MVRRELPFGEDVRTAKKALYRIDDPFLRFWFRVVAPRRGLLGMSGEAVRHALIRAHLSALTTICWEELCRWVTTRLGRLTRPRREWHPGERYWRGSAPELDVVAREVDGDGLLLGEAKWFDAPAKAADVERAIAALLAKGRPAVAGLTDRRVTHVLFVPEMPRGKVSMPRGVTLLDAKTVVELLRDRD